VTSGGTIAICGETLVDLVEQETGTFQPYPGGSPANVAVGLARLDVPATLVARLSAGPFGTLLRKHLTGNGVDLSHSVRAVEPATLAVVATDAGGVPSYEFWTGGTADWQWRAAELPEPLPPDVVAVHTGSLALAIEPAASVLTAWLHRLVAGGNATISFDPNIRPPLDGDPAAALQRVERQLKVVDIVKVSEEDLAWLAPGDDPVDVVRRWRRLGPALVVVTLGGNGAVAVGADGREVHRPAVPVEIADTIGAGDAFTAGLLAGLHRKGLLGGARRGALAALDTAALAGLLDEAALVAALTCSRVGADPPTSATVRQALPARRAGVACGDKDRAATLNG
jgi:fructokinase